MKVEVTPSDNEQFKLLFASSDYDPVKLNGLYKRATDLKAEREVAIFELKAEKDKGLTLIVNAARLGFVLGYLWEAV